MAENTLTAPKPPKIRTVQTIVNAGFIEPVNLQPHPTKTIEDYDWGSESSRAQFFEENAVFGCGQLNAVFLSQYEDLYGQSLDRHVHMYILISQFELFDSQCRMFTNMMATIEEGEFTDEELAQAQKNLASVKQSLEMLGVKADVENNSYSTPLGSWHGSLVLLTTQVVSFILSRFGRIVGQTDEGKYIYKPTTPDAVSQYLSQEVLLSRTSESGDNDNLLFEVLTMSRAYSMDALDDVRAEAAIVEGMEDDQKNLVEDNQPQEKERKPKQKPTSAK